MAPPKTSRKKNLGEGSSGDDTGLLPGRATIGPLLLLDSAVGICPTFVIAVWHTNSALDGSFFALGRAFYDNGLFTYLYSIWPTPWAAKPWTIIGTYMATELVMQRFLPGKTFYATVTPMGNQPVYTANGVQAYAASFLLLGAGAATGLFVPGDLYDEMGQLLSCMNVFALLFCLFLTVKGRLAPSTSDSGSTGNPVIDYYWGMELYPRILGWDVKQFTNCRFGMMFWALGIVSFAHKQYLDTGFVSSSMFVSVALQLVYITKFFWWETGYFCSMDIQHDRAGYYICWGCLVWLPCIYTSQTYYMVKHPVQLGEARTAFWLLFGLLSIWANYDADRQRQDFRKADGLLNLWGKPAKCVRAKYTTAEGDERTSCLLASGWWGLARHFHYIPEITASLAWSVPVWPDLMPYFYVVYLTILLMDRAWRDDDRCKSKYGKYWDEYTKLVPAKVIPGLI